MLRCTIAIALVLTLSACKSREEVAAEVAAENLEIMHMNAVLTAADRARCNYEATAGAAGTPGILMQLAVHGQLEELCLRSAAYAH